PERPIIFLEAADRPQPALDVNAGGGMSVSIGRLRACPLLDWKFTVLSHNSIGGAAGAALLNAELLKAEGYLSCPPGSRTDDCHEIWRHLTGGCCRHSTRRRDHPQPAGTASGSDCQRHGRSD